MNTHHISKSSTFLILLLTALWFTISFSANITCSGVEECRSLPTLTTCLHNEVCNIICDGIRSCHSTTFTCPDNDVCNIRCHSPGQFDVCYDSAIRARNSTQLNLLCDYGRACYSADIECPLNGDCNIQVNGGQPVMFSIIDASASTGNLNIRSLDMVKDTSASSSAISASNIYCPLTGNCNFDMYWAFRSMYQTTIHAADSDGIVNITASGTESLREAVLKCPYASQPGAPQCVINVDSTNGTHALHTNLLYETSIYAKGGLANDVSITCDYASSIDECYGSGFNPNVYCTSDYGASCNIELVNGFSDWECVETASICHNYTVTSAPTNNPSASPTNDPSVSPWTPVLVLPTSETNPAFTFPMLNVGETEFNFLFRSSSDHIIRRECPTCAASHQEIYYKRITDIETFDVHASMILWLSANNVQGVDFNLYSTLEDAINGQNAWSFCNYDDLVSGGGVGAFRDCGISGSTGGNWCSILSATNECKFSILNAGTYNPSVSPTNNPSATPTNNPSDNPSVSPSNNPSVSPSNNPSSSPTNHPSLSPIAYTGPCLDIDGGNWTLVRHAYNQWHPATDFLEGTDEYGTYVNDPQSMSSWSIPFSQYLWPDGSTQFMFSDGDCTEWLITTNDQFTSFYSTSYTANILSSYLSSTPYT
eukprot:987592_1